VEFALGEVDDMLACWKAVSLLPDVDPRRTWFLGSSHGAMASMLALGRDDLPPEIPGAIAGWGVYDVGGWLDWMEEIDHPMLSEPYFMKMLRLDDSALAARSAIEVADRIERAVFLLHGSEDTLVPPQQMLDMAEAFERAGKRNYDIQLEPGADHEYIWGPDRPEAIDGWSAIMDFIDKHK
jgi:dipeptidyl aminopeptidase/acylaminoacyl peptidase